MNKAEKSVFRFRGYIWNIGYSASLGSYEKRKLGIFNFMNFLGLVIGIILPVAGLLNNHHFPALVWIAASSPALISLLVLYTNSRQQYELARIFYFTLYPVM